MPYIMRKVRGKACYTVKNKDTGYTHAKCSTKENANKQLHMLRMIDAKKTRKLNPK